ncbi:MAG: DUF3142 domain-containing protein [Nitrospiraceae bacterium]
MPTGRAKDILEIFHKQITHRIRYLLTPMFRPLFFVFSAISMTSGTKTEGKRTAPIVHEAYVWQYNWNENVRKIFELNKVPEKIKGLKVLVGETGIESNPRSINVPWGLLKSTGRNVTICVRAGTKGAVTKSGGVNLGDAERLIVKALDDCRQSGLEPRSVQLDFDCPERLIGIYADRLNEIRRRLGGCALGVTALPAWLDSKDLPKLLSSVEEWTLQVHWTEIPIFSEKTRLFRRQEAMGWIRKASRMGKSLNVALPTYCYVAYFDNELRYLGVSSEIRKIPNRSAHTLVLESDPSEIINTMKDLSTSEFEGVRGVDWFRLPMPDDRFNWDMKGLSAVLDERAPNHQVRVDVAKSGSAFDLRIRNDSPFPIKTSTVRARWQGTELIATDAVTGWKPMPDRDGVRFQSEPGATVIAPYESRAIGWIRLCDSTRLEVDAH